MDLKQLQIIPTIGNSSEIIDSSSYGFYLIPLPLWKEIIYYLREEKQSLKSLRLVCKVFRKFIIPYWIQIIPNQFVNQYFDQIKKFNFGIQIIQVANNNSQIVLNLLDKETYSDSLFIACENEYLEIVKLLIENGADINKSDNYGQTPLFIACQNGYLEIVKLLIENGADINKSNNNGKTPLFIAREYQRFEITAVLIENGVDDYRK